MLRGACRRQVWMFFFDGKQRIMDPIIPMEDYPLSPDELSALPQTPGDTIAFHALLMMRVAEIAEMVDAAACAIVWERVGTEELTAIDTGWARRIDASARQAEVLLRGQFLLHDGGVREITPAEFA